jgi:flagellar hook-associated protein 3 FlgL
MRVTTSSFPNVLGYQLDRLATEQARLQTQAGTGQRFSSPSEDPRAMRKVLDLQTEMQSLSQYEKNIATLGDTLSASYNTITGLKKVSDRATEIATRADGLRTPEEMRTFSSEVDQLLERAIQLANTRHQSSYLFGGTRNSEPPFVATRDTDGKITGVTYNGSSSVIESEIAQNINISVTVPGENSTGAGVRGLFTESRTGADLFNHLISLRNALDNADSATVRETALPNLLKDEENIIYHFGSIGAIQSRLETASSIANRQKASLEGLVSDEADADLALTLVSLSQVQNAYTAALKTGGTILNESLLDYIR